MTDAAKKAGDLPADNLVASTDMLQCVSQELAQIAAMCQALQQPMSELVEGDNLQHTDAVFQLQNLDRVTQIIEGISSYLEVMAAQTSSEWRVDALRAAQATVLHELSDRLSRCDPADYADISTSDGDCELF